MLTHPSKDFDRWWERVLRRPEYVRRLSYHFPALAFSCLFERESAPWREAEKNIVSLFLNAGVQSVRGNVFDVRTALPAIEEITVAPYTRRWRRIEVLRELMMVRERAIKELEEAIDKFRIEVEEMKSPGDYRSEALSKIYEFVPSNRCYEYLRGYKLLPVRD